LSVDHAKRHPGVPEFRDFALECKAYSSSFQPLSRLPSSRIMTSRS
jgi:hypothetical protein